MSLSSPGISALVVFDLDGTLIDSSREIHEATNLTREQFLLPRATDAELMDWFGKHPRNFFLELPEEQNAMAITVFRKKVFESSSEVILFPDSLSTVKNLKLLGCTIGVATTKSSDLAIRVLSRTPLYPFIDQIQGTDFIPEKPSSAVFELLEANLVQNAKNTNYSLKVSVGDRVSDIIAGNSAGYKSFGILREFTAETRKDFLDAGASGVLESLSELPIFRELENIT